MAKKLSIKKQSELLKWAWAVYKWYQDNFTGVKPETNQPIPPPPPPPPILP